MSFMKAVYEHSFVALSKNSKVSVYMIKSYYYDDVSDLREFSTSDKKKIIKLFYLVAASYRPFFHRYILFLRSPT